MSKQESVADIISRRKKVSSKQTKKEVKKKPANKKAGVVVRKNTKKKIRIHLDKNNSGKTPDKDGKELVYPSVYQEFIRFIATLPNFRKLQTQGEFAKHFRVSEDTLSLWKKRDGFWDSVREERKTMMKNDMIPNIIMAVYRKP